MILCVQLWKLLNQILSCMMELIYIENSGSGRWIYSLWKGGTIADSLRRIFIAARAISVAWFANFLFIYSKDGDSAKESDSCLKFLPMASKSTKWRKVDKNKE